MPSVPTFSLLATWALERQESFINRLRHQTFDDGATIFKRDDPSKEVFFILSGAVKACNYTADGKLTYFRLRNAGDCFGYYGVISDQTRTATMVAVKETRLACMPGDEFFNLVVENAEIGRPFIKMITRLLRVETERISELTAMTSHQRLAAELATQAASLEHEVISLPDRLEFANYLGMSHETLSQTLSELAQQSVITVNGPVVTIQDKKALGLIANGVEGIRGDPVLRRPSN